MCFSAENLGYSSELQKNTVTATQVIGTFAAITGLVVGVLALHGAMPSSTALWTHVTLLGGVAILFTATVAASDRIKSKLPLFMSLITLLSLPVLFGSLGATGVIPPHNMLWASTVICGGILAGSFLFNSCMICKECACGSSQDRDRNLAGLFC